jgi:hypothetical protein
VTVGPCHICDQETGERFGEAWLRPDCRPTAATTRGQPARRERARMTRRTKLSPVDARAAALIALRDAVSFFYDALDKPMWAVCRSRVSSRGAWLVRRDGRRRRARVGARRRHMSARPPRATGPRLGGDPRLRAHLPGRPTATLLRPNRLRILRPRQPAGLRGRPGCRLPGRPTLQSEIDQGRQDERVQ